MTTEPGDGPVGVFDSGVGGLAVLWELERLLPSEDLLYYADQAHFPYGVRTAADVLCLSIQATGLLLSQGAKLIVVACNTASSAALPGLRSHFSVPIVGIEPAVKPACARSRRGRVGVLATAGTVQGTRLGDLIERGAGDVDVYTVAAGGLVELVENGQAGSPEAGAVLAESLSPLRRAGIDVLVLGCTHFAFLRPAIERYMGLEVAVLEPAEAVAQRVVALLAEHKLAAAAGRKGSITYQSSAGDDRIRAAAATLRSGWLQAARMERSGACSGQIGERG